MYQKNRMSMMRIMMVLGFMIGLAGCASSMVNAVSYRDKAKVQMLLDQGADINASYYRGGTPDLNRPPLMIAVWTNHADIVQFLIDKGANVNIRYGPYDDTPLMDAAFYARQESVKVLLDAGADPLLVNKKGRTALMLAKMGETFAIGNKIATRPLDYPKIVQWLEEAEKKARRKSENKNKQETAQVTLEAKLPAIQSAEKQGDEASQAGRQEDALKHYAAAIQESPRGSEPDQRLREKIIQYALSLSPPPSIPEEARHQANRGMAFVKRAQTSDDYSSAISEFEQALLIAPWWGDAYFNLGLVQEKAEEYSAAIQSFQLYLLAAPGDLNTGAVKKKIAELEVAQELAH